MGNPRLYERMSGFSVEEKVGEVVVVEGREELATTAISKRDWK